MDSGAGIEISVETLDNLDQLERDWRNLDRLGSHSFFVSRAWIFSWLRTLPDRFNLSVVRFRQNREIVGLGILNRRTVRLLGIKTIEQGWLNSIGDQEFDCITCEHNGLAAIGDPRTLLTLFLQKVGGAQFPVDEFVTPNCGYVYDPQQYLIGNASSEVGYAADLLEIDDLETLMARLSASSRYQLRAAIRRVEKIGPLRIRSANGREEAYAYFSELKKFHIAQWLARDGSHGAFAHPYLEGFCQEMIKSSEIGVDWDILRVSAGPVSIGYLFNFIRSGSISSYMTGFLDLNQGKYGYVSHALAMHHYARLGFHTYDFLAKENQMKRTFATHQYTLASLRFRKPHAFFQAYSIAQKVKAALRTNTLPSSKQHGRRV